MPSCGPPRRAALVATSRDVQRNFEIAAWAIRKHLDYVSTFHFRPRNKDKALNARIGELMVWWSKARNCDQAGRHPLRRIVRLSEARRTVNGDVFVLKLRKGTVQAIEGDRIRTPWQNPIMIAPGRKIIHGVICDDDGKAEGYYLNKRDLFGIWFIPDRILDARNVIQYGYYDRFDQTRGISPLAASVNRLRDIYEGFDYALAKAKLCQLFGLQVTRVESDPYPRVNAAEDTSGSPSGELADPLNPAQPGEPGARNRYPVDFGKGPFMLDMDPGDKAEVLESRQPSGEFQSFTQAMIQCAIKALDIPLCFYDESHTAWSGQRQAWLQYDQSARTKRADCRDLLDELTLWKLRQWVASGLLELPAGMTVLDLAWEWVAAGVPWIDPLREVQADGLAVDRGFRSTVQICRENGNDAYQIAEEEAEYRLYRTGTLGLPPNNQIAPIQLTPEPSTATSGKP